MDSAYRAPRIRASQSPLHHVERRRREQILRYARLGLPRDLHRGALPVRARHHLHRLLKKEITSREQEVEQDQHFQQSAEQRLRRSEETRAQGRSGDDDLRGLRRRSGDVRHLVNLLGGLRYLLDGLQHLVQLRARTRGPSARSRAIRAQVSRARRSPSRAHRPARARGSPRICQPACRCRARAQRTAGLSRKLSSTAKKIGMKKA